MTANKDMNIADVPFAGYVDRLTKSVPEYTMLTLAEVRQLIEAWAAQDGNSVLEAFYTPHEWDVFIGRLLRICGWRKIRKTQKGVQTMRWRLDYPHSLRVGWECYKGPVRCAQCEREAGGDPEAVMAELRRQAGLEVSE